MTQENQIKEREEHQQPKSANIKKPLAVGMGLGFWPWVVTVTGHYSDSAGKERENPRLHPLLGCSKAARPRAKGLKRCKQQAVKANSAPTKALANRQKEHH